MGGSGSGGRRAGIPGRAYTNRSDLNTNRLPIQTTTGQAYGARQAQEQAQSIIPAAPPSTPPLSSPSARPDEPVTAGLPTGPGPGPEVLGYGPEDDTALQLRALYALYPNNDLLSLIEELDRGAGQW